MIILKTTSVVKNYGLIIMALAKHPPAGGTVYLQMLLSLLLTWPPFIDSVLNIGGWSSLPRAYARGALGTVPIGLRATLCLIRHISV